MNWRTSLTNPYADRNVEIAALVKRLTREHNVFSEAPPEPMSSQGSLYFVVASDDDTFFGELDEKLQEMFAEED